MMAGKARKQHMQNLVVINEAYSAATTEYIWRREKKMGCNVKWKAIREKITFAAS